MAWLLLVVSLVGLALTLNAWRPIHAPSPLAVVSFFAGWLTAELAIHHVLWQAILAGGLVYEGHLASWAGRVAVAASVASCAGLVLLQKRAGESQRAVEAALLEGIGSDRLERISSPDSPIHGWVGAKVDWRSILLPFPVRHGDVKATRNVVFHRVGKLDLKLDIHRHKSHPKGAPTLVYVHGGGWVIGQRRYQGLPLMQHLAARGWVCFSVDYRLSPRATFPDHIVDVKKAIAWVREHAAEYGADPDFVILCGNSAGAHLAALAALTPNDPEYQPGFEAADTSVNGCIALYGIYDFTNRHNDWPNQGLKVLLERFVMKVPLATSAEAYAKASPIDRVHEGAPPFLVVHGSGDTLAPADESRRFCAALRAKTRAPVIHFEIPMAQHAFEIFPSIRTAHFLSGATGFVAHLYDRHLETRVPHPHRVAVVTHDPSPAAGEG
jgi:acetyl esterase/lipase